jgi:3-phenylpropionate/trans-cinnamate dioxygenase ferredoxin component
MKEDCPMKFVKVAETDALLPGSKKKITVEGRQVMLANLEGTFYAIDNVCPHMGGSLSDGTLEGNLIVCPRHGSVFDVTNGKAVKNGKLLFITARVHDLQSYPVRVEGGDVLLGLE